MVKKVNQDKPTRPKMLMKTTPRVASIALNTGIQITNVKKLLKGTGIKARVQVEG